MEILGIGTDIVSVARIKALLQRHSDRAKAKLFLPGEIEYCAKFLESDERFAGRYAAKEAVAKAIGTGMSDGVSFLGIEVVTSDDGSPRVALHGATLEAAKKRGIDRIMVSISHETEYAVAYAIACGGA